MIFLQITLLTMAVSVTLVICCMIISDALKSRSEILRECHHAEMTIINNYNREHDKSYFDHYGQGSRQKVLAREGNLIVLNFKNQDKMLAASLKKEA